MDILKKYGISEERFIEVCNNSSSAAIASKSLGLAFSTFKRIATKLGCYNTNQGGKNLKKERNPKVKLEDIFSNKIPYQTYKLKKRLINEGILEDKCSICGWCKKREDEEYTPCELHHINGNHYDNSLENLQILCPNCHSLTESYRSRNMKNKIIEHKDEKSP